LVQDFVTYFHSNRYCKPLHMFVLIPPGIGYRVIRFRASQPRNPSSPTGIRSALPPHPDLVVLISLANEPVRCRLHRAITDGLPLRSAPSLPLSLCLSLSLPPPPPSDRRSTAGSPASSPPPSPAWRLPGPSSGARRRSRPWRRCPGRGRRRNSPGAATRGTTSRGARRRWPRRRGPDGTRRTAVWHARRCQQPRPHRLGAVVHQDQLDAATGSILKKNSA
jgi:hypothetical protein